MTSTHVNGLISPPPTEKAFSTAASPPRIVLAGKTGRILCVADIRGDYHELNRLIREHEATAVIHTGDFGFLTSDSLDRMGDKILRHLLTYSPLLAQGTRTQLLNIPTSSGRGPLIQALNQSSVHFPLSQFPHLLSGAITFPVPVFTVWGLIEDVRVLERFRTGEYEVHNLNVIDEAQSRLLEVGGIKLRLFGLGGACVPHKLFDNGEGEASIAGGQGTMWATALQIGELIDTADRVYDPTETRLLVSSAPVSRNGLLTQIGVAVKADLTISGGLHFRYPASFNDFAVHSDFEAYRQRLVSSRDTFASVYDLVKDKVEASLNSNQKALLKKAVDMTKNVPASLPDPDESSWTNTWHWVLSDASCGHMLLSINDGRVSAETKSSGLNFSHRVSRTPAPPSGATAPNVSSLPAPRRPSAVESAVTAKPTAILSRPNAPVTAANIPVKPVAAAPTANNIKPVPQRPAAAAAKPAPTAPASSATTSAPNASSSSVPAKPVNQPPRQPRGPGAASQAFAGNAQNAQKDRSDVNAKQAGPAGQKERPTPPTKTSAPVVNGKGSPAPTAPKTATEKPVAKSAEAKPAATPAASTEKPVDGGKPDQAGADETAKPPTDGQTTPTDSKPAEKKWSLYLNRLPAAVTEDELKELFPSTKDKIKNIKIIMDRATGKSKGFAYIDFDNEADMQEALSNHGDTIRETAITVVLSNPPVRPTYEFRGRGRGGPGFRGRGGMSRFLPAGRGEAKEGGNAAGAGTGSSAGVAAEKTGGEKKETGGGEKKETTATATAKKE